MRVFVGMEFSGRVREAFRQRGHDAWSCDMLPTEDGSPFHHQGEVFETLARLKRGGWWPDLAIFHPTCTYLTCSAEWAYGDGPYHQQLKPGTLVGAARRAAREQAIDQFRRIMRLPIAMIAAENPIGVLSSRYRRPDQIVQPWWFGDDASKATCLWLKVLPNLVKTRVIEPRMIKGRPRWGNQTDGGQNRLTPSDDRWKDRSRTYPGLATAMAARWSVALPAGMVDLRRAA